ncbi:hypothetical protein HanIR_Chr10g0483301 [Helianthus annuus]|nr:hypothetical protein HanIR_Chr10g0483301 [Helianthus annuus]
MLGSDLWKRSPSLARPRGEFSSGGNNGMLVLFFLNMLNKDCLFCIENMEIDWEVKKKMGFIESFSNSGGLNRSVYTWVEN